MCKEWRKRDVWRNEERGRKDYVKNLVNMKSKCRRKGREDGTEKV